MSAPKPCCFVARLTDLEPGPEARFKGWAKTRCREFRVLAPVDGVSVACGILVTPPAKVTGFQSLWIGLLKQWKVPPGPANRTGKLRLLTLADYRLEMGTSTAVADVCANILDEILNDVYSVKDAELAVKAAREAYIAEQHRANAAFNALGRKRLRERDEAEELEGILHRKRCAFSSERESKGDDLDGNFRRPPPVGVDGRPVFYWWVTPDELKLPNWDAVLADRAQRQGRERGLPLFPDLDLSDPGL